jgi:hypothetical protein
VKKRWTTRKTAEEEMDNKKDSCRRDGQKEKQK